MIRPKNNFCITYNRIDEVIGWIVDRDGRVELVAQMPGTVSGVLPELRGCDR